ncbi:flagellar basal body P-ring formation chaperone FlgA [Alcaligenes sp. 1735tsa3]|jgi:flagella basal body P-ring formation protein FlgA|uniref:Flagella basal body P-ring formation protein FlgA n=1 Tax=Alcaligenes faecalis TaxID=511 RepID=A0AAE9HBY3_ALCFA|nr:MULTISPECIES: flagellar basal body P-ring formation chaperone FlgA [Alcaligenes]UPL20292.1 flagellar basal body P-ring formation protein FlgA [Alcaligenes faecalis]USY26614.1 flagellar basal body P-ring formation chaperone FlgA [Alcaligenes sp. 1735tsa3]
MTLYRLLICVCLFALGATANVRAQESVQALSVQAMQDQAQDYLLKLAQMYPGIATITLDSARLNAMPACTQNQIFLPSGQRLRSRMSIGVRCLSPQSWSTSISATLSIQGHYYVTNRRINPGETIHQDDLLEREGDLLALANGVVIDPNQIIGYVASQRIPLGNAIRASALRDPQSVTRGQMVRTIARGMGFVATGEGQALQSGSPGTQIQIKASSGQVISATVLDASTVQVVL